MRNSTSARQGRFSPQLLAGLAAAGALICIACLCIALLGGLGVFWWNRPEPSEFTLGPIQTYAVAAAKNTQINDKMTGYTLIFPEGGKGNLQIASITSGPSAPLSGKGIHIDYQGTTPIQLALKAPGTGAKMVVMGYGYLPGAYLASQWIALPEGKVVNGLLIVDLTMPFTPSTSLEGNLLVSLDPRFGLGLGQGPFQQPGKAKVGFSEYYISKLTPTSSEDEQVNMIAKQVVDNVQRMLDTLQPTGIYYSATASRDRLSPFEVDPYVFGKGKNYILDDRTTIGGPYYTGFGWGIPGLRHPNPSIHIHPKDPTLAQSLAHETGHYITHILVGDDIYNKLETQTGKFPDHGIGTRLGTRQAFYVEEPAYFAEYFLTDSVSGIFVDSIRRNSIAIDVPQSYDFPSVEGFGLLMLQSLHRQQTTIYEPNRKYAVEVPVVGASFGEIFEIISLGATGNDELLEHIRQFLIKKGGDNPEKLPALAERNGWRYEVKGRLLDAWGVPAWGYTLESISRVGCTDYKAGITDNPTGEDGKFTIDEVFPGDSILHASGAPLADGSRVEFDIPINIPWNTPTQTDYYDLGDLRLGKIQMFLNDKLVKIDETAKNSPGKVTITATAIGIPPTVKSLQWSFELSGDGINEAKVFSKNSKIQATETQTLEISLPRDVSAYHHEDETDYAIRVFLNDMTCGKQPFDMGGFSINITDEFPPATEAESHFEAPTKTPTVIPATAVSTPTETPIPTKTPLPAPTETSIPACSGTLRGVVIPDKVACYYGPGSMYLYLVGLRQGAPRDLFGRDDLGGWVLTRAHGDNISCWIKTDKLNISGDLSCLERIDPDNFNLPRTSFYGPLTGVSAARSGNQVIVSWDGITLRPDLDSLQTPYVIEAWVCRGGKFFFEPTGSYSTSATIIDEPGCAERSHGRVMAAEKHGYTLWIEIPWP